MDASNLTLAEYSYVFYLFIYLFPDGHDCFYNLRVKPSEHV